MGAILFATIKGYRQLAAGAQSRPGPRARHPLLAWHLAFWHFDGKKYGPAKSETADGAIWTDPPSVYEHHSRYIAALESRVSTFPGFKKFVSASASAEPRESNQTARNLDLTSFEFDWMHFRVSLRLERFDEYFTITTLFDLSYEETKARCPENSLPDSLKQFEDELGKLCNFALTEAAETEGADFKSKFSDLAHAAFIGVWQEFFQTVLSDSIWNIESIGKVFADFRGVVLSDEIAAEATQVGKVKVQQAHWRKDKVQRRGFGRAPAKNLSYWEDRFNLLWPLMTAPICGWDFSKYEFTASLFAGRRALYLSALGAQPDNGGDRLGRVPLCYAIYTHKLGGWSTGRLIEQIHRQGTLRLASLIDLAGMEAAGEILRDAEHNVRLALSREMPKSGHVVGDAARARANSRSDLERYLNKIHDCLAAADREALGGVEYRVERSHYYIRQFHQGIEALDIKPVGDMQPYAVFVERRLGPAFSLIDMVAARYQRVVRDRRSLYQQLLAEATHDETILIEEKNTELNTLQQSADFALIAFLIPYYFGVLFFYAAGGWDILHDDQHKVKWLFWLVLWIPFLVIAVLKIPLGRIGSEPGKKTPFPLAVAKRVRGPLVGLGILMWIWLTLRAFQPELLPAWLHG